jgi:hypothetical protein
MIFYAGIGSRETPKDVILRMTELGMMFAKMGFTLRSGGAGGADSAFEIGCDKANGLKEIFLPWKGFNKNISPHYDIPDKAYIVAQKFHPAWGKLSPAAKKLMARNTQQICGKNLDSPSDFIVCWTNDGCTSSSTRTYKTGGTGQAIDIASNLGIPVINLFNDDAETKLSELLRIL